ncbi:efflux RND transporter periplasmic adaptor subunit [Christiangramia echinicola]|uniref:Membrane fusion protein, Cu(I)/Ag(I) efflux system n=1 Tax=Christiangramia echinicola TaxID=279359 RepID=A0A1H1NUU5_9FLAO|nr:efflux RND transporter periplasmic adaptor subunit [Christiangramia echinicola]SDS02724.1 membrane fusion protein, Cu(I)/Ag(I) efflux system [Christiangramia echinicola]
MKKYLVYILILMAGLLLGYVVFNNDPETETHEEIHTESSTMWTCSMHPQIMQKEPGDCPICGMDLIPAENSSEGLSAEEISMTENAMKLANIETSLVGEGRGGDNSMTLSGKIEVNEDQKAVMPAHFNGRIEKLYVNTVGDRVSRGQIVASVYSPELVAAQQELITAAKLKNSQPQLYKAVRKKFRNWMISDAMLDEIVETGNVRTAWPVHANVTGTVTEIMVEEGSHIQDAMPILKVSNLNSVWAVFDAYESQISNLEKGQEMEILVNALPNENFSGKISFIDPILNDQSRTVEVRVVLNNSKDKLKPGMFVQAELQGRKGITTEQSLEIPRSAVMWTGERSLVYVKTQPDRPVFEMREVTLGNSSGETYQVIEGLSAGEEVVTNGTFTVDAAAQLQGKRSMMNNVNGRKIETVKMDMKLPESFQQEFVNVLGHYFELKDALVDSNPNSAANAAKSAIKALPDSSLQGMAAGHLGKVKEMLEAISKNNDLENQRSHFIILSENMIALATNIDQLERSVFVQHCPMANSNKGADWLSQSSEVRNPYYGDAMLTCGEVTAELK